MGVSAGEDDCDGGDRGSARAALLAFLKSIDGTTDLFRSEGDDFRDALRLQGTCPPIAPPLTSTPSGTTAGTP